MKLDRNIPGNNGRGKYALIKLRESKITPKRVAASTDGECYVFVEPAAIDFGDTPDTEFFVIRLKDKYAAPALRAYSFAAQNDDVEYAREVLALAGIADQHPNKRRPD